MKLYQLNKVALSLQNNVEKFLFGITSNTLDQPKNAFLNIHGKIVATFDQIKVGEDQFLILIEEPFVKAVLDHIDKFVRLSKVVVKQEDFNVYYDLDGDYKLNANDFAIVQNVGKIIMTKENLETNIQDEKFTLFRLKNHIPIHGIDYTDELLLNVDETDYVSFTKGCFLGQEPISKVHSRSKPSWKLVAKSQEECTDEEKAKMTSVAVDPLTHKPMGFVFVSTKGD